MFGLLFLIIDFVRGIISVKQPNILLIVADDLGYNDVSWHNPYIRTPNLEKLAKAGVILEQSYVLPVCTPTRSALVTGRYPIHTGRQHGVISPEEPRGLLTNLTILPEYLKMVNYSTHMVGKWHLGFCNKRYLPTSRGFDSFYGYYTGAEGYFSHSRRGRLVPHVAGYDFRNQEEVDREAAGIYSAHLFAKKTIQLIESSRNSKTPFFIYLAFQNVHSPLQVPEKYEKPFSKVKNKARRTLSGMVLALDEAVGNISEALKTSGKLSNTLIVFTTDNGGQTLNGGNNFPLRGNKATLWEGGTRGPAFIHGSMLQDRGRISHGLIHVTDWLPTLLSAVGGSNIIPGDIDGVSQWSSLVKNTPSPRQTMLYNIDPIPSRRGNGPGGAVRHGYFKLIRGDPGRPDGWIRPEDVQDIDEEFGNKRNFETNINKNKRNILLFNLKEDPYERRDISNKYKKKARQLESILDGYHDSMMTPNIANDDPLGSPGNYGGIWSSGWCEALPK